jgi:hypothetical protein
MSKVNVKEMKADAILHVPVNKTYYLMVKNVLFDLFTILQEKGVTEDALKNILKKPYEELSQHEKSFYTITLLLAEIERQAKENDQYDEKEFDAEKELGDIESKD